MAAAAPGVLLVLLAAPKSAAGPAPPADWSRVLALMSPDGAEREKAGKAILASRDRCWPRD
jgi:hypothetical protein